MELLSVHFWLWCPCALPLSPLDENTAFIRSPKVTVSSDTQRGQWSSSKPRTGVAQMSYQRWDKCKVTYLFLINLFIYLFLLCWVFVSVRGLSLVAASGGHSSSRCAGLSLSWPLLLRSTGSRHAGSVVVAHGPSCSAACEIFPDQGSNPCPLHWQADSQPLRHQGSPWLILMFNKAKQKQTHRLREWTYGYQRGRVGGGIDWAFGVDMYTLLYLK